jgi:uncharacterized protein (DUF58 family)
MQPFSHPYLDLKRMEMLRQFRIKPYGKAEGTYSGPHKSSYRGTALEFADYREYVHGDDIRLMDWKVLARIDKYYVRLYEAERNLLSYLVVDTSGSMEYSGIRDKTVSKLEYACRLAAVLSYLVVTEGDEVGLSLATDHVHTHYPPRANWPHLAEIVESLGNAQSTGRTDLGNCLKQVFERVKRRGVIIVLSDFLDDFSSLWKTIDLMRKSSFDVMLFHIVHPEELDLPDVPMARFMETEGENKVFTAEPEVVRSLYKERFNKFLRTIEAAGRTRGCNWFLTRTDVDPYMFLKKCFLSKDSARN